MTYNLIELVFNNVSEEKIGELLLALSLNVTGIARYASDLPTTNIDWCEKKSIEKFFAENSAFWLFINSFELKINGFILKNCGLVIQKDDITINLEINFEESDVKGQNITLLAENLMKFAKSFANQYLITDYFCGLEPARDMETRLFTNEQLGPLLLRDC